MKKILLLAFGLVSLVSTAQKTIVEEKFDKEFKRLYFSLLPNTNVLYVKKCKPIGGLVAADYIKELSKIDVNGNKIIISNDKKLYGSFFSKSEEAFSTSDITSGIFNGKSLILIDDKFLELDNSGFKKINYSVSDLYSFTSKNFYTLNNKSGKSFIDLNKDEIVLGVYNVQTKKTFLKTIEKPKLSKLIGTVFIKPKENLGCKLTINFDESIDLITKSITSDYKKVVIYKTRLSDAGIKIKENEFKLELPNNLVFINSLNDGGFVAPRTPNLKFDCFADDLSINNYIEDSTNGDIYVYGLFGDKAEMLNMPNNVIKGYYIFKYDKDGNKIWESINPITDKNLNKIDYLSTVRVKTLEFNNKLYLTIAYNTSSFFNSTIISKDTGKIEKTQNFVFNEIFNQKDKDYDSFNINSTFQKDASFKKKKFNFETISFINFDKRVLNYIKTVNSKNEVNFNTFLSNKGIWLTETDEKTYYKVTYFNHE